jgi:hypothetical protein
MLGIGTVLRNKKASAFVGVAALAGFGSTDPVEHAMATYEDSVMGDSNYSERLLGRQMGGYGLLAGLGPVGPNPLGIPHAIQGAMHGATRNSYLGNTMISNAITYKNAQGGPPGSMVFGMFNSRMS